MSLPALNLTPLDGVANPKLLGALQKLAGDEPDAMRHGLDELMSLTKRSDYVVECLDLLLKDVMLLERLLACLAPGLEFPGEVAVRGVGLEACSVPMGEAIQLAACSALGELIWQRDTSSEVRPVLLEKGGMRALATLIAQTPSERVRLKVLVLARRMMYEVGSTSTMDPLAFQAAKEADLMGAVVGMLSRVVAGGDATVTLDTLEGVVYLLQRMQVCMSPEHKEESGLAAHLRQAAQTFTQLLRSSTAREAIDVALLGIRELCWDDHNDCLEPSISQFAEAGAFEAIAALLAPPTNGAPARPSASGDAAPPALALLAAVDAGVVNKTVVGSACSLLEKLAAAKPGALPTSLAAQVPRLFHQVISALVDQLDHAQHAPERQEVALFALRKLLVTDTTQSISKPATEAADAEGVPTRLLAVALSGADFGGPGDADGGAGAPADTARSAAALLADLVSSTALLAAHEGRPAQAADALTLIEPLVLPLVGQLTNDVVSSRAFCNTLYHLSVLRWDEPLDSDDPDDPGSPLKRAAPPEEEQYKLSSALVTVVGKAAQGLTALLGGGYVPKPKVQGSLVSPVRKLRAPSEAASISGGAPPPAAESSAGFGLVTQESLQTQINLLQRATMLMHDLAGLRPQPATSPISKHNIDALFVHGAVQALVQLTYTYYCNKRTALRAQARAEAEALAAAAGEVLEDERDDNEPEADLEKEHQSQRPSDDVSAFISNTISRASSMSANQNPLLHALLSQDTGALELIKELVRDCADARIKLRDIGALPHFARMLQDNPRDNLLVSLQFNLARSEPLHAALKQEGVLTLMEKVLKQMPQQLEGAQHEVRRLLALCVLGLISSDEGTTSAAMGAEADLASRRTAQLLEKHDIIAVMEKVLREACRDGRYVINNSTSAWPFTLEPAAYTAQCLARDDHTARKLCERKIPSMLLGALRNKHGAAPEPALRIVRALLNFARLPDLRAELLALDAAETLAPYTQVEDLRTCDAARGCLLQLGELPDMPAKVALQATLPQSLKPVLSQPLPTAVRNSEAGGPTVEPVYDVLLCYKRQDAHALARALHTTLVLRGIGCLLEYEYQADLSDVPQVVARARNLVVILSDNCLTSPRCLAELSAAANYDVNVIMVVKEGARWGDSNGNMLSWPPQQTIKALRPELHKLFTLKAVHHRDEHYAYFVTQLLKRVKTAPVKPTTPPPPRLTGAPSMRFEHARSLRHGAAAAVLADASPRPQSPPLGTAPTLNPGAPASTSSADGTGGGRGSLPGITASEFHALAAAVTAQTSLLSDLRSEVASVRTMAGGLSGVQNLVQSLQAELASLRREMSAEVAANARQVSGEVATMSQQVRQAMAGDADSQVSAIRAEVGASLATGLASIKAEISGGITSQMRMLSTDVSELRRGLADSLSSLAGLQGQVRALVASKTAEHHNMVGLHSSSPQPILSRTAPPVITAMHGEGAHYHSSPVRSHEDASGAGQLHPFSTSGSTPSLPLIHGGGANGNQQVHRSSSSYTNALPSRKSAANLAVDSTKQQDRLPTAYAPNVAGFAGARIAAVQARLNTVPRGAAK